MGDGVAPLGGVGTAAQILHAKFMHHGGREIFHDHRAGGVEHAALLPRPAVGAKLRPHAADIGLFFAAQLHLGGGRAQSLGDLGLDQCRLRRMAVGHVIKTAQMDHGGIAQRDAFHIRGQLGEHVDERIAGGVLGLRLRHAALVGEVQLDGEIGDGRLKRRQGHRQGGELHGIGEEVVMHPLREGDESGVLESFES